MPLPVINWLSRKRELREKAGAKRPDLMVS
jgi:hypothetical protein